MNKSTIKKEFKLKYGKDFTIESIEKARFGIYIVKVLKGSKKGFCLCECGEDGKPSFDKITF